jgi:hypothetical protein
VNPLEASKSLRALADGVDRANRPSRAKVAAEIRKILDSVSPPRTAGKLTKFTEPDYKAALGGMSALIDRLGKAAKTLNPQDDARAEIEQKIQELNSLRGAVIQTFKGLESVEI